jgi:putative nucleotidyltransferase with HDIG domain
MNEALKQYVQNITKLPTIPVTAQEIMRMIGDENATVDKLEKIISNDPAISAKILSVANSAFFGVGVKTNKLSNAIMRIGFNNVKNIALGISLMTVLGSRDADKPFDYQRLFNHSVTVGFTARLIAKEVGVSAGEEIIMNGLLHDIGYLVLNRFFPGNYKKVMDLFRQQGSLLDAEKKVLEFDHCEIGLWLAEKWGLPGGVCDAVAFHHSPSSATRHKKMVSVIHLADYLVSKRLMSPVMLDPGYPLDGSSFEILGITEDGYNEIESDLESRGALIAIEI